MVDHTSRVIAINTGDSQIISVAISPNGRLVAAASWNDSKAVNIWDVQSGVLVETLRLHEGWVNPVTFTPDGMGLVGVSNDNTLKYWDLSQMVDRTTTSRATEVGQVPTAAIIDEASFCTMTFRGHEVSDIS
jgi:WD40 repeat protein